MMVRGDTTRLLPEGVGAAFKELRVLGFLRAAGIKKSMGLSCSYLFTLIFSLIFEHKNWFRLLQSTKSLELPSKDAVYRFMNCPRFAWRRFLSMLSTHVIAKVSSLTSSSRVKVLIVDDTSYERNRSKVVELLAWCFDHSSDSRRFYKGFRLLTLGWSDGTTFLPVDFAPLSSLKKMICEISSKIDKRTSGYKRRLDALKTAPVVVLEMITRALDHGVQASYVLMDSWFMMPRLILQISGDLGLDVIGMVKDLNQRYIHASRRLSLKELYQAARRTDHKDDILRSIITTQANGVRVKIVFVRNRNKKSEWLAILSTDISLSEEEIVKIYGIRWDIEVFFKTLKSLLKLQKEFQGRSFDGIISHTTIVFVRYIILAWQSRSSVDDRTIGGMFFEICDEIKDLDWAVSLQQLFQMLDDIRMKVGRRLRKVIECQVQQWIQGLPSYIRDYLPPLSCES